MDDNQINTIVGGMLVLLALSVVSVGIRTTWAWIVKRRMDWSDRKSSGSDGDEPLTKMPYRVCRLRRGAVYYIQQSQSIKTNGFIGELGNLHTAGLENDSGPVGGRHHSEQELPALCSGTIVQWESIDYFEY